MSGRIERPEKREQLDIPSQVLLKTPDSLSGFRNQLKDSMNYTLQPLGSRLIVRLRPEKQKGLIIRVANQDSARAADVVSVGPEVKDFEPGQGVLVSALAGQQVGEEILLPESSVLAYLDD